MKQSSPSPSVANVMALDVNTLCTSTGTVAKSLARTKERCAERRNISPGSTRRGTSSFSMVSQHLPFTTPKNLILPGAGNRRAQEPPAVKPPDTTDWVFDKYRMSEGVGSHIRTVAQVKRIFKHSKSGQAGLGW